LRRKRSNYSFSLLLIGISEVYEYDVLTILGTIEQRRSASPTIKHVSRNGFGYEQFRRSIRRDARCNVNATINVPNGRWNEPGLNDEPVPADEWRIASKYVRTNATSRLLFK